MSIAHAVRWCLDNPSEARAIGELGRRRIETAWNYETQFAPVMRMMQGEG